MKRGPILPDSVAKEDPESLYGNIEVWKGAEMPSWLKSAAKLLNGGSEGQDWTALAKRLGQLLKKLPINVTFSQLLKLDLNCFDCNHTDLDSQ